MKIPTETVKELREQSGAGIMECRNALLETEGDVAKALQILRERSIFSAEKIERMRTFFIEVEPVQVTATRIREKIARGETIRGLVPEAVEEYILDKGLYGRSVPES